MLKKSLKWTPATPIRRPDNIPSSRARTQGDHGFQPSYSNEGRENMNHIMSNEYMRKWYSERDYYQRELFIKIQTQNEERQMKRRFVQRMLMPEKREKILPIIQLKKFQNISKRTETKRENKATEGQEEGKEKVEGEGKKEEESKAVTEKKVAKETPKATKVSKKEAERPTYQRFKPECPRKGKNTRSKSNGSSNPVAPGTASTGASNSTLGNNKQNQKRYQTNGLEEDNINLPNSFAESDGMERVIGLMIPHCGCRCRFKQKII